MRGIFAIGTIMPLAYALVPPEPSMTDPAMKELGLLMGMSPKPTPAPFRPDLVKRQSSDTSILAYLAPDNTCGYVDGIQISSKSCDIGSNCAAIIGTDDYYTLGCCGTGSCELYGVCYDYEAFWTSSACDSVCQEQSTVVLCTGTDYPYCYGYSVPAMSMGFFSCASITASTFEAFPTTYDGEVNAVTWEALRESDLDALLSTSVETSASETNSGGQLFTATGDESSTTGIAGASNSASGTQASTSATLSGTSLNGGSMKKSSTPVAAIAGGAVGGLVAIGAVVGVILFFVLKKKKAAKAPAAGGSNPQMSQQAPGNGAGGAAALKNVGPSAGYENQAGNTQSMYGVPGQMNHSDAKYGQNGVMVTERPVSAFPQQEPAPAYTLPGQNVPPQQAGLGRHPSSHFVPSPISSPPPPEGQFAIPPQQQAGFVSPMHTGEQHGFPPNQAYAYQQPNGMAEAPGHVPQNTAQGYPPQQPHGIAEAPGHFPQNMQQASPQQHGYPHQQPNGMGGAQSYAPQQGQPPAELGNTYAVPSQMNGQPVYEAQG